MNRTDLVEIVAEKAGTDRAVARRHVDAVFDSIIEGVSAGDRVLVTGFGTFDRFDRAARTARNPRTGETIEVAAGAVPRFRFGQTFKNRVAAAAGSAPAPVETAAAEVAPAPAVTEAVPPKKGKKPKKDKKAAADRKPAAGKKAAASKKAAKKPGGKPGKPGKKGSGKKSAKAR